MRMWYADDLLLFAGSVRDANEMVADLIAELDPTGLTVHPEKCKYVHVIGVDEDKVLRRKSGVFPDEAELLIIKDKVITKSDWVPSLRVLLTVSWHYSTGWVLQMVCFISGVRC